MNLIKNSFKFKKKTALITNSNDKISYHQLSDHIKKFSKYLDKRELVFLICDNNIESIVAYLSTLNSNSAILLIENDTSEKNLKLLILKYKPTFIFLDYVRFNKISNVPKNEDAKKTILLSKMLEIFIKIPPPRLSSVIG